MISRKVRCLATGVALVAVLAVASACGGALSPPEACAAQGSADEVAFARSFNTLALAVAGETALPSEEGGDIGLSPRGTVQVVGVSKEHINVNLCLQERKGGGKVRYNETPHFMLGEETRVPLGSFEQGNYVVRVIVEGVLVRNLTFYVR